MPDLSQTTGRRLRPQVTMTVHPDTVDRMRDLCDRFRLPRGQVVDKLVAALHGQYQNKTMYCASGGPCRVGRTDVPDIL